MFEKWWYYGPLPQGWGSRICLKVERYREVGVAALWRPREELGGMYMYDRGPDGEWVTRWLKQTILFELTLHLLLWRVTFWAMQVRECG